jgi:hypothetical protein
LWETAWKFLKKVKISQARQLIDVIQAFHRLRQRIESSRPAGLYSEILPQNQFNQTKTKNYK